MTTKYKAYATITYELTCEFEIEDGEDPWEFAYNLDGGDFQEIDNSSSWELYEVQPINEVTA